MYRQQREFVRQASIQQDQEDVSIAAAAAAAAASGLMDTLTLAGQTALGVGGKITGTVADGVHGLGELLGLARDDDPEIRDILFGCGPALVCYDTDKVSDCGFFDLGTHLTVVAEYFRDGVSRLQPHSHLHTISADIHGSHLDHAF